MQQFYENLQGASRREVIKLFQNANNSTNGQMDKNHFVPFNQERDKLGKLISREGQERISKEKRNSLPARIQNLMKVNPQSKISQKVKLSNKTVQKLFKLHEIKGDIKHASLSKLRILSTVSRDKMVTPTIGHYDIAHIADKVKFQKAKFIAIQQPQQNYIPFKKHSSLQIPKNYNKSTKRIIEEQNSTDKPKQYKKIEINYDLPELQMYHEKKKLKMKHYDNFEENHLRFKQLARYSLVLANQIKKGLELD